MNQRTITTDDQWNQNPPRRIPSEAPVTGALLCPPDHFDVVDIRNAHMEGKIGTIDRELAKHQWLGLADAIESLGFSVYLLESDEDLVDQVFTANPSLVTNDAEGIPRAIVGRMSHPNRKPESALHQRALEKMGLTCQEIPAHIEGNWEGNGDTLKHPHRALLWCGVGSRSDLECHLEVGRMLNLSVALLQLPDPDFYHLDTALSLLDERCAAYVPAAFDQAGNSLLQSAFDHLIEVDDQEAREQLSGNLWCPDGKHVLMPAGAPVTRTRLESAGFQVIEIETSEFLKSGGSVFCMRQEIRA